MICSAVKRFLGIFCLPFMDSIPNKRSYGGFGQGGRVSTNAEECAESRVS